MDLDPSHKPEQEPTPPEKSRSETFSSLANRNFRLLWLGMFVSINGMQMLILARGWLVYSMTGSALALGLVAAGQGLPMMIFSLFGGAVADRVNKKKMLLFSQTCLFLISLTITLLITFKLIALWHLIASAFLTGLIGSFNMPARQAFILDLVGRDNLTNAIALNSMAQNFCRIASPAFGGLLLKLIGTAGVYWIVVVSYGLVICTLVMIQADKPETIKARAPLWKDMLEGLKYIRNNPTILALLVMAFVPIIVASPYSSLMPVFAKSVFKAGETGLGLLMASAGIGALCGSTFIASLGDYQRKGFLLLVAGTIFGTALILFGLSRSLVLAFIFLVFVGAGGSMYMTLTTSLIMGNTPRDLVGRVMSIFIMTFGLVPMAVLPAGALAEIVGAPLVVSLGGLSLVAFIAVMGISRFEIRRLS